MEDIEKEQLARCIRRLIDDRGWGQVDLVEALKKRGCEISATQMSRKLNIKNPTRFNSKERKAIATVFGMSQAAFDANWRVPLSANGVPGDNQFTMDVVEMRLANLESRLLRIESALDLLERRKQG